MSDVLTNHYVTKIEGHGRLNYNLGKNLITVEIDEGERLFEKLVVGQSYLDVPFITARICGVCPTSHVLASIFAIENAFGVKTNDSITSLRRALQSAQIVQSHALHLFFLVLPDYLSVQNGVELHEKNPRYFEMASKIKELGDTIIEVVGGRAVHPVSPTIGGFLSVPERKEIEDLITKIRGTYRFALEALDIFAGFRYPHLERPTEYFSLTKNGVVDIFGDTITSSGNVNSEVSNYSYVLSEKVKAYSTAKHATHEGHGLMVGAIARLNLGDLKDLNTRAKKAAKAIGIKTPLNSSFENNLAQAIEIIHFLEEAEKSLTAYLCGKSERIKVGYRTVAGTGVGAVEAPRGTLYHAYEFDKNGIVKNCDIITPTVQNLTNLEDDANEYLRQNKSVTIPRREKELEMLVRAYDPCITCSVH